MPISIACPHCDWTGKVKDELAGKKGKCPTCGELIPIPAKGSPPPVRAGRKPVDDEPDVVDDADIVEDEPRSRSKSGGRPGVGSKARRDDDDRPRRRRDEDDEDDRPSKSRRRDDDEDERSSKARRRPADDDEDDDRPRKRRVRDDDDDDRPRRRRSGGKLRRRDSGGSDEGGFGMSPKRLWALIGGVLAVLVGGALLVWFLTGGGRRIVGPIILIVCGLIGIFQGLTGAGLGEDD